MVHTPAPSDDTSPNPLPTNEQQRNPCGPVVAPAVAGRAPPKRSTASPLLGPYQCFCIQVQLLLWTTYIVYLM